MRQEAPTRTASLHLRDVLLPQSELLVDTQHILTDGERRHAVDIVWDTTKQFCTLPGGERLPPRISTTSTGVHYAQYQLDASSEKK